MFEIVHQPSMTAPLKCVRSRFPQDDLCLCVCYKHAGSAGVSRGGLSVPGSPSGQYRTDCPVGGSCHPSLFLPASCEFGGKKNNILICEAFTVYRKMISHTLNKSFLLILSYNIEKMKSEFLDG